MKKLFFAIVFTLMATLVSAQTPIIITPASTLNFTPAPDYASVDLSGSPVVTGIKVLYCLTATPTNCLPPVTISPRPPIGAGGEVVIANIISSIQPNTSYIAKVLVSGPGGDSAPSNTTLPFGNAVLAAPLAAGSVRIIK